MSTECKTTSALEAAVHERYSEGARERVEALCCATSYDPKFLEAIPTEVSERDCGCGNPSPWLRAGETVLDLGSGSGKICFIASQVVGESGRVIGIDMTDEMLALARSSAPIVADRIGYSNVDFRRSKIQDMRAVVDDGAVDVVGSNCVLNLVDPDDKRALFDEIFRVLSSGGRAIISDIVASADVPEHLQRDPELWSGCISGAFREDLFVRAFEAAGFGGIDVVERQADPWQVVDGIEFRSLTVVAYKNSKAKSCC